jgi:erythromycin esterase-like protein/predicted phosphoribosyltransferase
MFRDRRDAGRALARQFDGRGGRAGVTVLGLPRGGVPVAYEVAMALAAPLDVLVVRNLGAPGRDELAMGAIAGSEVVVVNDDVVRALHVDSETLQQVAEREGRELHRRVRAYRMGRPPLDLAGRTVILVDDGLATGVGMRAAIRAVRRRRPAYVIVAVPAAPASTCEEMAAFADEVVCATTPSPFFAVGDSYWDFMPVTDDEVRHLLRTASAPRAGGPPSSAPTEVDLVRAAALPTENGVPYGDALLDVVGDAHFVLIGDASHGTHEFCAARASMTQKLIEERDFCAVAAEADWPDAYRVNRFVRGRGEDTTAEEALRGFQHFPTWMWRNTAVADFVGWLRAHNDRITSGRRRQAGFYGLDLYNLHMSVQEVIAYLERVDPEAAQRARARYSCFDHHRGDDGQTYGMAAAFGAGDTCERQVVEQLADLRRHALQYARRDGLLAEDEHFCAEQNARVVKAAARYYRAMFSGRVTSWNLRDRHMVDTLDALSRHLTLQRGEPAKIVVWAHNSHLGDARAAESAALGELNVGQLVRERHQGDNCNIGFTTCTGTVTAADDWGAPAQRKWVRPALPDSIEQLYHEVGEKEFLIAFGAAPRVAQALRVARLQRAIGVVYRPQTERQSHYFRARPADQFDAMIHIDDTRALEPLERTAEWKEGEIPETYPFAV